MIIDKETNEKVLEVVNANSNLNVRPLELEFAKVTENKNPKLIMKTWLMKLRSWKFFN